MSMTLICVEILITPVCVEVLRLQTRYCESGVAKGLVCWNSDRWRPHIIEGIIQALKISVQIAVFLA